MIRPTNQLSIYFMIYFMIYFIWIPVLALLSNATACVTEHDLGGGGDAGGSLVGGDTSANPDAGGPKVCEAAACGTGIIGELIVGNGLADASTGVVSYRPIEEGDEVVIEPGWQGGQHIWMILRAHDVATDCFLEPHYRILDAAGEPVLDRGYGGRFYPLPDDPEMVEFLAYAAFVADPEHIHRQTVTLQAEVSDGCGHLITDEVEVVAVDHRLD